MSIFGWINDAITDPELRHLRATGGNFRVIGSGQAIEMFGQAAWMIADQSVDGYIGEQNGTDFYLGQKLIIKNKDDDNSDQKTRRGTSDKKRRAGIFR